ncbi:MAG: tRNA (guanosine(46)-N7)-methyltransferase TrmB [Synergistaceae bacterium]|nr:tRNA (guanosine(46)-N7)-methyltransferase TrmB [Synergistaceae bacterium]
MFWDLDKVIVTENDALPVDWKSMSPSGRIFVEIGFGNGEFLEYLARAYPDVLIVGVEVSQWCASKGARLALSKGLGNIRVMHGDARFLLRHCFPLESVERVFMNFPCPWPKTRHAARRVTVPVFSELLNYLLVPGGSFELATDVDWYAEEAAKTISEHGAFDADPVRINPERPYMTKYERKWKAMGKDTWHLTLRKNGSVKPETDGDEEWAMEAETKSEKTVECVLEALKGAEGTGVGDKGHWVFRESFISAEGVGLVLVITADEGFEQHFYLKVIKNGRGGITIKVDSVGHPYRTPAMRAALLFALDKAK